MERCSEGTRRSRDDRGPGGSRDGPDAGGRIRMLCQPGLAYAGIAPDTPVPATSRRGSRNRVERAVLHATHSGKFSRKRMADPLVRHGCLCVVLSSSRGEAVAAPAGRGVETPPASAWDQAGGGPMRGQRHAERRPACGPGRVPNRAFCRGPSFLQAAKNGVRRGSAKARCSDPGFASTRQGRGAGKGR